MKETFDVTYKYKGWFGIAPILIEDINNVGPEGPLITHRWWWTKPLLDLIKQYAVLRRKGYVRFVFVERLRTPVIITYEEL